jgi:hypothetical protein
VANFYVPGAGAPTVRFATVVPWARSALGGEVAVKNEHCCGWSQSVAYPRSFSGEGLRQEFFSGGGGGGQQIQFGTGGRENGDFGAVAP